MEFLCSIRSVRPVYSVGFVKKSLRTLSSLRFFSSRSYAYALRSLALAGSICLTFSVIFKRY